MCPRNRCLGGLLIGIVFCSAAARADAPIGLFENHSDVGKPKHIGSVEYKSENQRYLVMGGGKNMWGSEDAFHFVWRRMSGDVSLAATIRWPAPGKQPHRKACLLIRQSLDPDSAYVDAALHGDGLTSLQYREAPGERTCEIQSNVSGPARIRIEKRGDRFFMSVATKDQPLRHAGGSFKIQLKDPFYLGLGVCAHDDSVLEKAEFIDVELTTGKRDPTKKPLVESTLEVVDIASKDRRVIYHTTGVIEAPNWTSDGRSFLFNSKGRIYRLPSTGGEPQMIDTGFADRCNNDHGFSPDGNQLAISHHGPGGKSLIYLVPSTGGVPKQLTPMGPSYFHGWSPDGKTVVYCAERSGEFDVYSIPVAGGDEKRLTSAPGLDDGPEFSPDGNYIYFNSVRTGKMQIWRMRPDGSNQEQITADEFNNWFPHPSPDSKWIVFLSYAKNVEGHPANKDVQLRLLPVKGGPPQTLAKLFGGQGTINVPSWSPDSRRIAFISYLLVSSPDDKSSNTTTAQESKPKEGTAKKHRGKFTISKETTYVTGPLDKDGYIDYAAALNEQLGKGVTPENNANVLIWKAIGPIHGNKKMPAEFFQLMGIPEPPEKGEYFIELSQYLREHLKTEDPEELQEIDDQLTRSTQRPWSVQQYPKLASWLKANEKPLVTVVEASRRPQYFSPMVPSKSEKGSSGLISALMPGVQECRAIANALTARAMLNVRQGANEDAWQDLLACHRLGRLLGRRGTLIEGLVGMAIDGLASKADVAFLEQTKPNAERIKSYLHDLQSLPPLPAVADMLDLGERYFWLDSVMLVDRYGIRMLEGLSQGGKDHPNPLGELPLMGIDWDAALQNGNHWFSRMATAMRENELSLRRKKLQEIDSDIKALKTKLGEPAVKLKSLLGGAKARGEFFGEVMISLFVPAILKVHNAEERTRQVQNNVRLAFALAWYQLNRGKYPKTLNELAPKYLKEIPNDLFSGKSLIYRPKESGYLLYSVGVNGKDDDGRGQDDDPPGDDLSIQIPLPELPKAPK